MSLHALEIIFTSLMALVVLAAGAVGVLVVVKLFKGQV